MTGDFSRSTFDASKDYSLVRMQQGRLFTDADWNEQGDILRDCDRKTAADLIGHCGFPEDDAGFALIPDKATGAIIITSGTGYVAGVRHVVRPPARFVIARSGGPSKNPIWRIVRGPALANGDPLTTDPAGLSGFVRVESLVKAEDGTRTFRTHPALSPSVSKLSRPCHLLRQPYGTGKALPTTAGPYLAVLKSTELPVTALDDPLIREVAFEGPDTAIRDRTTWQAQLIPRSSLQALGYSLPQLTCPALADGLDPVIGPAVVGKLQAQVELSELTAGPCTLPPAVGYRSLDNLLFRVEIHNPGNQNSATYKWSRDNAIHRTRYSTIDVDVLVVESTGRDELSALKTGDWIEIRDLKSIHGETPGFFARLAEVVGERVSLAELLDPDTLSPLLHEGKPDISQLPNAAFVTRWEGGRPRPVVDATSTWANLENGVQVHFSNGAFQCCDHWLIPARAVSGDVEWPRDPFTNLPLARAPHGPRRDYAALAWLNRTARGWTLVQDCRPLFPPLNRSKQFLCAGGDGQEALPNPLAPQARVSLPKPLEAVVVRGHAPVAGESIRFHITAGDGRFGNGSKTQTVHTDAQGKAAVHWHLDAITFSQRVEARRLDTAGQPTHHVLAYNASLSRAAETSYDPAKTPAIAGAKTVQEAIEGLAALQQVGCNTYILRPGADWVAVLEGLEKGENASICFARGTYTTSRTVRVKHCGHLRLSGAGPGTVQIIGNRVEAALAFEDCQSVAVSGLEIAAPDGNSVIPVSDVPHRQGALDISHCRVVEVRGCLLRCGAGTSPARSCLTIKGSSETDAPFRASESVRVCENTFSVGNLQDGLIVIDAIDIDIANNHFSVRPRLTSAVNVESFLADKVWLASAAKGLVQQPVKARQRRDVEAKQIAVKQWRMTFTSPVAQYDWDKLVKENPPAATALGSEDAFKQYADNLINKVVEKPDVLPKFNQLLSRIRQVNTTGVQSFDQPEVRRTMLLMSEPVVERFDGSLQSASRVVIEANGQFVSFDSPFSQVDWNRMIANSEAAPKVANADELLSLSYALAGKVLVDAELNLALGSVRNWLKDLRDNGVSLGMQAIVCAGRRLDNVSINNNIIREFQVGIRVAPSHKNLANIRAKSICIDENRMELLAQHASAYAGYGMMIGNVETLRIRGNEMRLSSRPNFIRFFAQGIRIWGFIGLQVLVSQNRIEMATLGIRLQGLDVGQADDPRLWIFRENLVRGPKRTRSHKVTPGGPLVAQNNLVRADL